MKKWKVYGTVPVSVTITVEAETAEDAIEVAYDDFDGLAGFVGNGGNNKFVGTTSSNISLDASDGEVDFTDADEA